MQIHDFTPISALAGGALIGLAATILLLGTGKIAGISGVVAGVVRPNAPDRGVRIAFLLGMLFTGLGVSYVVPSAIGGSLRSLGLLALAGVLVGFGARLGSGCTSGHGVCGLSRFSKRSLIATLTFMATAGLTVLAVSRLGAT